MTQARDGFESRVKASLVILASLAFGLSFGLNFGVANQAPYLIAALRVLDPSLLTRDWWAMETTHYHPAYTYLATPLLALSERGVAVVTVFVLVLAGAAACLYRLLRVTLGPRLALAGFFSLVTLALLTRTQGPATTYLFDTVLQPSTLGSALFLASVPFFIAGRFGLSGILLAASMLFHMNLGPLLFGAFALAHLQAGREQLGRRLLLQFSLPLLVFAAFLPTILRVTGSQADAEFGRHLFLYLRNPHHFVLGQQWPAFLPLCGWQLLGVSAALPLAQRSEEKPLARLLALAVGASLIVALGVLLSVLSARLSVNLSWRIAAHAELLSQAAFVTAVFRIAAEPGLIRRYGRLARVLVVSGFLFLLTIYSLRFNPRMLEMMLVLALAAGSGAIALFVARMTSIVSRVRTVAARFRRSPAAALAFVFGVLFLSFVVGPLSRLREHSSLLRGLPAAESELYAWMRSTPKNTLFLTPPEMERIRFVTRRAIVVDWKSAPAVPREMVAWYRRMEDVTGRPGLKGPADMVGYASLDSHRLEALHSRYGLDYAIVRRGHETLLPGWPKAYENSGFVVLDTVRHPGVAAGAPDVAAGGR